MTHQLFRSGSLHSKLLDVIVSHTTTMMTTWIITLGRSFALAFPDPTVSPERVVVVFTVHIMSVYVSLKSPSSQLTMRREEERKGFSFTSHVLCEQCVVAE